MARKWPRSQSDVQLRMITGLSRNTGYLKARADFNSGDWAASGPLNSAVLGNAAWSNTEGKPKALGRSSRAKARRERRPVDVALPQHSMANLVVRSEPNSCHLRLGSHRALLLKQLN